jgi:hypothetical protein
VPARLCVILGTFHCCFCIFCFLSPFSIFSSSFIHISSRAFICTYSHLPCAAVAVHSYTRHFPFFALLPSLFACFLHHIHPISTFSITPFFNFCLCFLVLWLVLFVPNLLPLRHPLCVQRYFSYNFNIWSFLHPPFPAILLIFCFFSLIVLPHFLPFFTFCFCFLVLCPLLYLYSLLP